MERTTFAVQMKPVAGGGDAVEVEGAMVGPRGAEEVEFLISPNVGEEPRPLSKIASGGELSRIMLAIKKILTKGAHDQTLVFDEVDAGIGGQTAEVVGHTLQDLARYHQILCVTHLPQIAAFGTTHYHVAKREEEGRTITSVERLAEDTRGRRTRPDAGGHGCHRRDEDPRPRNDAARTRRSVMIRQATIADAEHIQRLINQFAEEERLLPRSLSEIYDNLRDFSVSQGADGKISGVCALHICWEGLAEIRSLAVTTDERKKGVGGQLIEACLEEAKAAGYQAGLPPHLYTALFRTDRLSCRGQGHPPP